jgi:hypothetical protein
MLKRRSAMLGRAKLIVATLSLVVLACVTGCGSITSELITPEQARKGEQYDGMPIVVQRPRFLKVTTKKVCYALVTTDRVKPTPDSPEVMTSKVGTHVEWVTEVSTEPVSVGEVYAVDLVRPMSGTAKNGIEFAPGSQYPSKLNTDVEDKSVTAVGDLIGDLLTQATGFVAASGEEAELATASTYKLAEHVVSVRLYDLDDLKAAAIELYVDSGKQVDGVPKLTVTP